MAHNRVRRFLESDEDRIVTVTAVVGAAVYYQQEGGRKAGRLLTRCVRNCLRRVLDREPTREEIDRVLRGEM
jgi:hypothetical protein